MCCVCFFHGFFRMFRMQYWVQYCTGCSTASNTRSSIGPSTRSSTRSSYDSILSCDVTSGCLNLLCVFFYVSGLISLRCIYLLINSAQSCANNCFIMGGPFVLCLEYQKGRWANCSWAYAAMMLLLNCLGRRALTRAGNQPAQIRTHKHEIQSFFDRIH